MFAALEEDHVNIKDMNGEMITGKNEKKMDLSFCVTSYFIYSGVVTITSLEGINKMYCI
jgi:hypothetical protein